MAVGRRIGNALLQAMETATAAMEMQQKQKNLRLLSGIEMLRQRILSVRAVSSIDLLIPIMRIFHLAVE